MNYKKAIAAVIATILVSMIAALSGGNHVTPVQWTNIAISGVGACAIFQAPNVPFAKYTKTVLAVLMAVLSFVVTIVVPCTSFSGCHFSNVDLMQLAVIVLNTLGVWAVPNTPPLEGAR